MTDNIKEEIEDKIIDYMIKQITKDNKKFKLFEKHEAVAVRRN